LSKRDLLKEPKLVEILGAKVKKRTGRTGHIPMAHVPQRNPHHALHANVISASSQTKVSKAEQCHPQLDFGLNPGVGGAPKRTYNRNEKP
jgi:hypothetical protein